LGSRKQLFNHYDKVLLKFNLPTSVKYYLVSNGDQCLMVMTGLVGYDNLIAQLCTVKLANIIDISLVHIVGSTDYFVNTIIDDVNNIGDMPVRDTNVLIIASCGMEDTVAMIVKNNCIVNETVHYHGEVVSFSCSSNQTTNYFVVNLVYGDAMLTIVSQLLQRYNFQYIFSAGAGGFLPSDTRINPPIGTHVKVTQCANSYGELVKLLDCNHEHMHLHIPTLFFETYRWLLTTKDIGSTIDIETFYIIKAIQQSNKKYKVVDCGIFVSDHIGQRPLRSYNHVYDQYETVLSKFLSTVCNREVI